MTTVVGRVVRPRLNYSSFTDLTDVPVADKGITAGGITFAGDLSPEEEAAVYDRMTSRDDADQAARDVIRVARDAVDSEPTLANVAALAVLTATYGLGELP